MISSKKSEKEFRRGIMDNILVAGANGAAGSYLCEYIVREHPEVQCHGLSRWHSTTHSNNLSAVKDKVIMHECDLNDLSSLIRVLRVVKPVKVFNLAAHANVRMAFETPLAVLQNNMMSTANLLEGIRLECPDTIYNQCSTSEVYGDPKVVPITEEHRRMPVNPYAASKLCQESLVYAYFMSYKLKAVITRAFAYICPRRMEIFSTWFAYQIKLIEEGKKDKLHHGNLQSIRTLIDVRDIVHAYWIASEQCEYGLPYNIGGKGIISVGQFLDLLIKKAKCPIKTYQDPALMRPTDITNQVVDVTRFVDRTGWEPRYSLEQSVEFLLEHVRGME